MGEQSSFCTNLKILTYFILYGADFTLLFLGRTSPVELSASVFLPDLRETSSLSV